MTIGEKIKMIREFRGMTQKELGIELGFSPKTAQIRMAHYEAGIRVPKKNVLFDMCDILNACIYTLDMDACNGFAQLMETLLWSEEEMEGRMHIARAELDPKMGCEDSEMEVRYAAADEEWRNLYPAMIWFEDSEISKYFKEWSRQKEDLKKGKITKEQYFEWKIQWPNSSYVSVYNDRASRLDKKIR